MREINILNKKYFVKEDEFNFINHINYNNLKIIDKLGYFEKIISFLNDLSKYLEIDNLIINNISHGGFIPINCSNQYNNIYIIIQDYELKILENIKNIRILDENILDKINFNYIFLDLKNNEIIIKYDNKNDFINYVFDNINVKISQNINKKFIENFYYYLKDNLLNYDNLNNLCIMVKNAGEQFEEMLLKNIDQFDRWTILDTGSTDNTIDIIKKILVGKKKGNLYQEPFINFRDSRNRLLELAGTETKYITVLDDTYVIKGDLINFLNEVRGDIYANSFSLYIKYDDVNYCSNRIIKSNSGLKYKYKIHEIIDNNNNVNIIIPYNISNIEDRKFDYMEKRTIERKNLDLKLLYEELEDNPDDPRIYYYLAQTYNILNDYEKAFYYFNKRCEFINSGFLQERYDSAFELARLANFKLNKSWDQCYTLYIKAYNIDENRPEPLYFIGIHYYLENNFEKAYIYLKKGFEIGYPIHSQYSLKPTLSFHFLPKFLTRTCYYVKDYILGEKSSEFFLLNNDDSSDDYEEILSWFKIYKKLNIYKLTKKPLIKEEQKDIFCFVADGGFNNWTGSDILKRGMGGSETFIIEIARYIKKTNIFNVFVFCNTPNKEEEIFEGVNYKHLDYYYEFINKNYVKHCFISRFSEYLPVSFEGFTENVYFIIHDLLPSGNVIPMNKKLKNIFCLSEWHVEYFTSIFPKLKDITTYFYYGIDDKFKKIDNIKKKNKFIYSSYPDRGLLQLLEIWPKIYEKEPSATLHIYSDINNTWSNNVQPKKMESIKNLLSLYLTKKNKLGIYYYGWVNKKILAEAWNTTDIWFYPCTFMETFCLTALEAASSKTLCITSNLAALQNTVGNRGVIIEGDPTTSIWKKEALKKIFYFMDENNINEKQKLIDINYKWSNSLSWENQANKLLNDYIYHHNIFEYKNMYNWTNDLPEGEKKIFLNIISYFNKNYNKVRFGKKINILEIGTYTGISLINLVKLIPNSYGTGIDLWTNYNENETLSIIDEYKVKNSFYKNIKNSGLEERIIGIQNNSTFALLEFIKNNIFFDFIYIDGSHLLLDCYSDLILSWQILEKGGILAIDDYTYKKHDENLLNSPYYAVNHFFKIYEKQYKILNISYRVFIEKI
jgi:predicted O-methyltransferase YrrM